MDPQLVARARSFDKTFVSKYALVLQALGEAVAGERVRSPWIVDSDVSEVYKALAATMKTLSTGIYYETLPEGPARIALFRAIKAQLDRLMESSEFQGRMLRVSEVLDIVDFLILSVDAHSSGRPRSRQYLDWISTIAGVAPPPAESSRIIIP